MRSLSRLFALAPDCHAVGNRYAHVWQRHFYEGLRTAVPEVMFPRDVDFTWARPASLAQPGPSSARSAVSERLADQIRIARPDLVMSYCFSADIDPGLVRDTIARGFPWVNFFCDSTYAFDRVAALAREASLNWFPESAAEPLYRALGRPLLCRPYALNPAYLQEAGCRTGSHRVGFMGAARANRALKLAALAALGCRVELRGPGWRSSERLPRARRLLSLIRSPGAGRARERVVIRLLEPWLRPGGELDDADVMAFISQCRLILGLNEGDTWFSAPDASYLKLRDVEFPGHGACYLTQHNADVARAFEIGREILTFSSLSEAASIVRHHAIRPEAAAAIGRAGRRRVLSEHTWTTRLGEIAKAL